MFGFQAINNSGSVTINDNFPLLIFSERGQVVVENTSVVDRPAEGSFLFLRPKKQLSPPKIFVRFNSGRHGSCDVYLAMIGSPGNWTGATIYAGAIGGGILPRHVLDYVVCETTPPDLVDEYGMVIYNSLGQPTYKSEDKLVKYTKFTSSWSSSASDQFTYNYSPIGISIDLDDYIDISSMNRGPAWMNNTYVRFTSMRLLSGGVRVLGLTLQLYSTGGSQGSPSGRKFCIPICKFPNSVYN